MSTEYRLKLLVSGGVSADWPGQNAAPRVGLEPTTNGLTVPPQLSAWYALVSFSEVLSERFAIPCRLVRLRGVWYGYTYGYTSCSKPGRTVHSVFADQLGAV